MLFNCHINADLKNLQGVCQELAATSIHRNALRVFRVNISKL